MGGFFAFDFVLRLNFARVMDVAFVVHVFGVHTHDFAADPASFRIPAHAIANFEPLGHGAPLTIEKQGLIRTVNRIPGWRLPTTALSTQSRGCLDVTQRTTNLTMV
jgi:hypothetical protein